MIKLRLTKVLLAMPLSLLLGGCGEKTDEELLEEDREELKELLYTEKVNSYKLGKILIRASIADESVSPEYAEVKPKLDGMFNTFAKYSDETLQVEDVKLQEFITIYKDYKSIESFVRDTDEDIFPTLIDVFAYRDADPSVGFPPLKTGKEKERIQNMEHAFLSASAIVVKEMGKDISVYELVETEPEHLDDSEIKTLLYFFRGFLFFEKGLLYLSEDELSRNIDWLNEHPLVEMNIIQYLFRWTDMDQAKTFVAFHALNHLLRGTVRLSMDRDIDEERAMEDFDAFLKDAELIGLDNELVWAVQAYLYIQRDQNEEAVIALKKLQMSTMLSEKERERIGESIDYLENRESGKSLNSVYDKVFIAKVSSKYVLTILAEVDWRTLMKEQNIPYADETFESLDRLTEFYKNISHYTSTDQLKEIGEETKEKGKDLWNKTKELVD